MANFDWKRIIVAAALLVAPASCETEMRVSFRGGDDRRSSPVLERMDVLWSCPDVVE